MSSPSEFKPSLVKVAKEVQTLLKEVVNHVNTVESASELSKAEELSVALQRLADRLSSKYNSFLVTHNFWLTAISQINEVNEKDAEKNILLSCLKDELKINLYELQQDVNSVVDLVPTCIKTTLKYLTDKHKRARELELFEHTIQSNAENAVKHEESANNSILAPTILRVDQSLPSIKLPMFDGTSWKYQEFIQLFKALVDDNSDLDDTRRHQYLHQCLKGEALEAVQHIPKTAERYEEAKTLLKDSFYKPLMCRYTLVNRIQELSCNKNSLQSQLSMTRQAKALFKELQTIEGTDKMSIIQTGYVKKYSENVQKKVLKKQFKDPDLSVFEVLKIVEEYLVEETNIQSSMKTDTNSESRSFNNSESRSFNSSTSFRSNKQSIPQQGKNIGKCVYCSKHINSSDCKTVSLPADRFQIIKDKKLCSRCLSSEHNRFHCSGTCAKCGKEHHESIHDDNRVSSNTNRPPNSRNKRSGNNNSTPSQSQGNSQSQANEVQMNTVQVCKDNPQHYTRPTGKVRIGSKFSTKEKVVDFFVDTGADSSVITEELAKELDLPTLVTATVNITGFGEVTLGQREYDFTEATLKCSEFDFNIKPVVFKSKIIKEISRQPLSKVDKNFVKNNKIRLADHPNRKGMIAPQLLIGGDDAAKFLNKTEGGGMTLPSGLTLLPSAVGHIVFGKPDNDERPTNHEKRPDLSFNLLTFGDFENRIDKFLSLDEAGQGVESTEKEMRKLIDQETEKFFNETIRKQGDKYVVRYRLKENWKDLPDNKAIAFRRLQSSIQSLHGNPEYLKHYDKIMKDQLQAGQIEVVDESKETPFLVHYLPHQAVLRPDKPTTPLRVVYDASAKMKGKMCLNDIIFQSPNNLEQIPALLLRSRLKQNMILADVEKAFLQVSLHESQRDMLRFLWLKDVYKDVTRDNIVTYRFTVTPFGVNQSPYVLGKIIQHHLRSIESDNPLEMDIINQLLKNIYVDNVILTVDEPLTDYYEIPKRIFSQMGMNLREFISNDQIFNNIVPLNDRGKDEQKLLGVRWDPVSDNFTFQIKIKQALNKRQALSEVASQYDPLGVFTPLLLKAKVFIQSLWKKSYKWDENFKGEDVKEWTKLLQEVQAYRVNIPRFCHLDKPIRRLVMFSDASDQAMGACIYNGCKEIPVRLLISRSKLAPSKFKSTIPKLELNACILGFNLLMYTVEALSHELDLTNTHIHPFCDSTVVIHWLSAQTQHDMGPYVSNRLKKFRQICTAIEQMGIKVHPIKYVNTKENPADDLTRGLNSDQMNDVTHRWYRGPKWLDKDESQWPQTILPAHHDEMTLMSLAMEMVKQSTEAKEPQPEVIDTSRYSSLMRLCNVTATIRRYVSRLQNRSISYPQYITSVERGDALLMLIRMHQHNMRVQGYNLAKRKLLQQDAKGIWRGNNRKIVNLDDIETKPIFLVGKDSNLIRLIIREIHTNLHHAGTDTTLNEIKRSYWIPRIRSIVKRTLRECTVCRKANNLPYKYPDSVPLPDERVHFVRPFEDIGLDFIGPFKSLKDENMYILLLTCFTTRAIHLEVVTSMSTECMIMAFKRFAGRRGRPKSVLSDKAPTFRTAKDILRNLNIEDENAFKKELANQGIDWKFTTAHSPWQGGVYERLVGCVKQALYKSIGKKRLTVEQFNTIVCEIEGSVNSRPLTYVSSEDLDSHSPSTVRPIDFIIPNVSLGLRIDTNSDDYIPRSDITTRDQVLKALHRNETIVEKLKSVWINSFLTSLRDSTSKNPLHSYRASSVIPELGAIVLVVDESGNTSRNTWPMAVITGIERHTITLRTSKGTSIERPQNLLIPLEISCSTETMAEEVKQAEEDALLNDNSDILSKIIPPDDKKKPKSETVKKESPGEKQILKKLQDIIPSLNYYTSTLAGIAKDMTTLREETKAELGSLRKEFSDFKEQILSKIEELNVPPPDLIPPPSIVSQYAINPVRHSYPIKNGPPPPKLSRPSYTCVYCKGDHRPQSCPVITTCSERMKIFIDKKLCFNCAYNTSHGRHDYQKCSSRTCFTCKACGHNESFCPTNIPP